MDKKNYNNMTEAELIKVIEKLIEANPENEVLVHNILNNKNPNWKIAFRKIEREMKNHTGSYELAFKLYSEYSHICVDKGDLLKLAIDSIEYFIEELDLYSEYPEDLIDYTNRLLQDACKIAIDMGKKADLERIIGIISSANDFMDYVIDIFMDTIYEYVPYDMIREFEESSEKDE